MEASTGAREKGKAGPQSIAGSRMRIAGERIKEKIREPVACKVLVKWYAACEDEPLWIDSSF